MAKLSRMNIAGKRLYEDNSIEINLDEILDREELSKHDLRRLWIVYSMFFKVERLKEVYKKKFGKCLVKELKRV